MILVTGATGSIGQQLCRLLSEAGIPMRAMCRKEEQVRGLSAQGIPAVQAGFDDPASLHRAMDGCTQLFLVTPSVPEQCAWQMRAIDIAIERGVESIVRVSTADSNLGQRVPWARAHAEIDHGLRSKAVRWTLLRPTAFMQNFLDPAPAIARGILPHATGTGRVCYIDARDIASVARCVLTTPGHDRATYYLTGMESLAVGDVAARLTEALERPVRAVEVSADEMQRSLRAKGLSEWFVDGVMAQFAVVAGGYAVDATEEVRRITGRPARSFVDFARDARAAFG